MPVERHQRLRVEGSDFIELLSGKKSPKKGIELWATLLLKHLDELGDRKLLKLHLKLEAKTLGRLSESFGDHHDEVFMFATLEHH